MTRSALPPPTCRTERESGNPYFETKAGCVTDLNDHSVLGYSGAVSQVIISAEIGQIHRMRSLGAARLKRSYLRTLRDLTASQITRSVLVWDLNRSFFHC
jgi:hypothetical protein